MGAENVEIIRDHELVLRADRDYLERQVETLADEARALAIVDQQSLDLAGERLNGVADLRRKIQAHHAPMKKSTYDAWQVAIKTEKVLLDPVEEAEKIYKKKIGTYTQEQERLLAELRARAEAEARRIAEEEREREIEQAEAEGADLDEITAMASAPLSVAPPVVEPSFRQAKGISTAANWKGEVTNLLALVKAVADGKLNLSVNLLQVNEKALNQLARYTRGSLVVPGVRFYDDRGVRTTGRR
jgi:hypothetical protein